MVGAQIMRGIIESSAARGFDAAVDAVKRSNHITEGRWRQQ
jgi:hypothetical protein